MKIKLADIAGEFCTTRNSPGLPQIISILKDCLDRNENVEIELTGVKLLTPSFIDELIPPLIIKYGKEKIDQSIVFRPALVGFVKDQIDRGVQQRLQRRS